jgi:mediator of RNA polymerase II transcription subunit 12
MEAFFKQLSARNAQVSKTKDRSADAPGCSSRRLISILDSAMSNYRSEIWSECMALSIDSDKLVSTVLCWASTRFRSGLSRVYIAVRLLRKWRKVGVDTDTHILTFLINNGQSQNVRFNDVYHVIAELIRSQSFSVGRYLQWLLARGAVSGVRDQGVSGTSIISNRSNALMPPQRVFPDIELLSHIPSRRLPSHVWNLRNTLLQRACGGVASEQRLIDNLKSYLQRQLPSIFGTSTPLPDVEMTQDIDFSNLTWTVRCEICNYVRERVASRVQSRSE